MGVEGVEGNLRRNLEKEKISEIESKEPWANMFQNYRAANNGMNLTYVPPQIIYGHTIV